MAALKSRRTRDILFLLCLSLIFCCFLCNCWSFAKKTLVSPMRPKLKKKRRQKIRWNIFIHADPRNNKRPKRRARWIKFNQEPMSRIESFSFHQSIDKHPFIPLLFHWRERPRVVECWPFVFPAANVLPWIGFFIGWNLWRRKSRQSSIVFKLIEYDCMWRLSRGEVKQVSKRIIEKINNKR